MNQVSPRPYSLSFVFPMYNERENIEQTILSTIAVANQVSQDYEIIVVDDGSTDGSGELVDRLARKHPQVKAIHNERNVGLGRTLRVGFAAASKEIVMYIDSDLPIDFNDVKTTLPMIEDADLVCGYRLIRTEGFRRWLLSKSYNSFIRLLFGLAVKDVNFSYKFFRRAILDRLQLYSDGSFIDAELLLEARRFGFRVKEVGMMYYPRAAGQSNLSGPRVILKILKELWEYKGRRNGASPL